MNEKLIAEFLEMGCKSRRQAALTLQVYLDLCEVRKCWDVQYFYDENLDVMYLTGKHRKSANTSIFVPVFESQDITYNKMQDYFSLRKDATNSIIMAITGSDSTCVYYKIDEGISDVSGTKEETVADKRNKIDAELRRNRAAIEEAALLQIPFNLPGSSNSANK